MSQGDSPVSWDVAVENARWFGTTAAAGLMLSNVWHPIGGSFVPYVSVLVVVAMLFLAMSLIAFVLFVSLVAGLPKQELISIKILRAMYAIGMITYLAGLVFLFVLVCLTTLFGSTTPTA